MTQFVTGAPIWVWPVLVVLVVVGLRARQDRRVLVGLTYALPLLGILAVRTVMVLPASFMIWLVFGGAYAVGAWGGYLVQRHWILCREGQFIHVKGENLTLLVMMIIFWANFVAGALQAIGPEAYASSVFHILFTSVIAASSGSFAGRAVRIWRQH